MRSLTLIARRRFGLGMLAFLLASCTTETPPVRPFAPNEPTLLSTNSPTKDEDPSVIRALDGTIFVAWFSDRGGNADIYVTSTRNGRDWTTATRVTTNAGGDFYPNLYQDDQGLFHLAWFRWTAPFVGHIIYNTSTDGLTWNTSAEVQATNAFNVDDWVPTITTATDGTVLIYFVSKLRNTANQQNDLYLAVKRPGMAAFDPVVAVSDLNSATEHDHLPFVARTGVFTMIWVRYDLSQETPWLNPKSDLYVSTSANGLNWTSPLKLTTEAASIVNLYPALYADLDSNWSLVWLSTRGGGAAAAYELPLSFLSQYPAGVTANVALPAGYSHRIAATMMPGVYIGVWVQGPEGAQDIYYRFFER